MTSHHKNEEMRLFVCVYVCVFTNTLSVHFFTETSYEIPVKMMFYTHYLIGIPLLKALLWLPCSLQIMFKIH